MRVLDHGCWMCRAGDTAEPPPLSLLLRCPSDLSVCFPLPTPFSAMYSPAHIPWKRHFSGASSIGNPALGPFPWKCWDLPTPFPNKRHNPLLSQEQTGQASVLAPPGITDGQDPEPCFALGCLRVQTSWGQGPSPWEVSRRSLQHFSTTDPAGHGLPGFRWEL